MLAQRERYKTVPFFWSQHYDVSIDYVGHAAAWEGLFRCDPAAHDAALRFEKGGRVLAVATIFVAARACWRNSQWSKANSLRRNNDGPRRRALLPPKEMTAKKLYAK